MVQKPASLVINYQVGVNLSGHLDDFYGGQSDNGGPTCCGKTPSVHSMINDTDTHKDADWGELSSAVVAARTLMALQLHLFAHSLV